jgi:hypothetical protein
VAAHDTGERRRQDRHAEVARERQGERYVVGRAAGIELVEEPEPLLGEGEGKQTSAGYWHDRRQAGGGFSIDPRRQGGQTGSLEQDAQGEVYVEDLAHSCHDASGEQRMAAEVEEVGTSPDAEGVQSQDLRPDPGKPLGRGVEGHSGLFPSSLLHRLQQG